MEETGENHQPVNDKLYHIMLYRVHRHTGLEFTTLMMIGTDCINRCKSNYHTITTMTAPINCQWHYRLIIWFK